MYYVYIIKGSKYYVGCTNNIDRRYKEHKRGNNYFTKRIGENIELLGYFEYKIKEEAIKQEIKIKKSGHISRYINNEKFIWVSSSAG
ncbi:MAG: GIY-YIG nuclease family protein [Candidatus Absconditabacteria bacterium]|nr:GIY-YIG nuclease family protein [Candidatus Absconditabacteria bacterium]